MPRLPPKQMAVVTPPSECAVDRAPRTLHSSLQYFGTASKAVAQRAATGGAGVANAAALPRAAAEIGGKPALAKDFLPYMRPHPVTFYPAQMRMAL